MNKEQEVLKMMMALLLDKIVNDADKDQVLTQEQRTGFAEKLAQFLVITGETAVAARTGQGNFQGEFGEAGQDFIDFVVNEIAAKR